MLYLPSMADSSEVVIKTQANGAATLALRRLTFHVNLSRLAVVVIRSLNIIRQFHERLLSENLKVGSSYPQVRQ